ncbi:MAG TPA: acylphosphatase, partial [Candidatus Obscuribacter sp.]|nr:acylphosphatase [Candidatus Obscuribacter sp.]
MTEAMKVRVEGVVQGVGFRPFVYTLAKSHNLSGWVLNDEQGVEIFLEGARGDLDAFLASLSERAPQAARLDDVKFETVAVQGFSQFEIVESRAGDRITTRISPDLSVCSDCLADLNNPADFHYEYPYVNCTNCGPRFSIIRALPYDRSATT